MSLDWKSLVSSVAPMLGGALGGPLGAAAVETIANALGLSDKTEATVKQALSGVTPDQMLAVKNADNDFTAKMAELGFKNVQDLEALAASDRNSARQREEVVKDNTPRVLAYLITLGFFGMLAFMLFSSVPQGSRDLLNILMGALASGWISVTAYYFGSSSGSAAKTDLLAKAPAIQD